MLKYPIYFEEDRILGDPECTEIDDICHCAACVKTRENLDRLPKLIVLGVICPIIWWWIIYATLKMLLSPNLAVAKKTVLPWSIDAYRVRKNHFGNRAEIKYWLFLSVAGVLSHGICAACLWVMFR